MRCRRSKDYKSGVWIVGYLAGVRGTDVDCDKLTTLARLLAKPADNLGMDFVATSREKLLNEFTCSASH
jgi:hypothetical protein